jgi:hypothetical protein
LLALGEQLGRILVQRESLDGKQPRRSFVQGSTAFQSGSHQGGPQTVQTETLQFLNGCVGAQIEGLGVTLGCYDSGRCFGGNRIGLGRFRLECWDFGFLVGVVVRVRIAVLWRLFLFLLLIVV